MGVSRSSLNERETEDAFNACHIRGTSRASRAIVAIGGSQLANYLNCVVNIVVVHGLKACNVRKQRTHRRDVD